MKKIPIIVSLLLCASLFADNNLGESIGIPFGMKLSEFSKIDKSSCSKQQASTLCQVDNNGIIDDKRIEEIFFYFNSRNELYYVKYFSKTMYYFFAYKKSAKTDLNKELKFFNSLPMKNKKLLFSPKADIIVSAKTDKFNMYNVYKGVANSKMYDAAILENKRHDMKMKKIDNKKTKSLKANL